MKWFCPNVPEYLLCSTIDLTRASPKGNRALHAQKMPWTPELIELVRKMREDGETWYVVTKELEDRTGIRIAAHSVQDYLARKGEI
jgi:hypothetical protein